MIEQGIHTGRMMVPMLCLGTVLGFGCRSHQTAVSVSIENPTLSPMTIAVAPALNLSGSKDFDPNRFADIMASELSYAEGISVVPVSRVLGVLGERGLTQVDSRDLALELVDRLGADAILVFAVTGYDPYDPPKIGISAQLFGTRPGVGGGRVDPVALSRQAGLVADRGGAPMDGLLAQHQQVYDAAHQSVVGDIRAFAARRNGEGNPYGWRKYVVSQQHFIEFCCHTTIAALLNGGQGSVLVGDGPER